MRKILISLENDTPKVKQVKLIDFKQVELIDFEQIELINFKMNKMQFVLMIT